MPKIEKIGGLNVCMTVAGGDAGVIEVIGWLCHGWPETGAATRISSNGICALSTHHVQD